MNPRHRDSTAFLRVCSGRFERDMVVKHHRLGSDVRLSRPHSLVAKERNTVDMAYPGDIIGIINPDTFHVVVMEQSRVREFSQTYYLR